MAHSAKSQRSVKIKHTAIIKLLIAATHAMSSWWSINYKWKQWETMIIWRTEMSASMRQDQNIQVLLNNDWTSPCKGGTGWILKEYTLALAIFVLVCHKSLFLDHYCS